MRGGSEMSRWDDNLTSHVRRHHAQLLSKTQSGAETIKETPKVKKSDGTLMSFIVICCFENKRRIRKNAVS